VVLVGRVATEGTINNTTTKAKAKAGTAARTIAALPPAGAAAGVGATGGNKVASIRTRETPRCTTARP